MRRTPWAAAALALLLAGCLNEFEDPVSPHHLRIAGIDVSAPVVTSGTVWLAVNVSLDNVGGESPPVRLVVKAYDSATQLLTSTNETGVGVVRKDETRLVEIWVKVARASSYRLEVLVFEEDRVVQRGSMQLNNVAALPRNLFDSGLRISEMDFLARNVTEGRVRIDANVYITNEADVPSKTLRMQLKAREVTTGLLADDDVTEVPPVAPEETKAASVELDVPSGYNYEVEAVLWDADFIVERGSGAVQLLPTFTKPVDEELVVSKPDIGDFIRPAPSAEAGSQEPATPSPLAPAVLGILLLAAWLRRR